MKSTITIPKVLSAISGYFNARSIPVFFLVLLIASCMTHSETGYDREQLPVRGEWIRTSDSPLSPRKGSTIAWNGTEIFVFGGNQRLCAPAAECFFRDRKELNDGAAYNPLTDTWQHLPDIPLGPIIYNTATIGTDIFVLSTTNVAQRAERLYRYRTSQDVWEHILLPDSIPAPGIVEFGRNLVLYTATSEAGHGALWQLDTATRQWEQLPDDPLGPGYSRRYISHGDDLYLFDHALVPSPGGADGPAYVRGARFRDGAWMVLPTSGSFGRAPLLVAGNKLIAPVAGCADGGDTNGYGGCLPYGAIFDTTTDTWQALPNVPDRGEVFYSYPGGVSDDSLVLSIPGYPAFDAVTNQWFIIPQLDGDINSVRSTRAAGPYGFSFGGSTHKDAIGGRLLNEAWIWRP